MKKIAERRLKEDEVFGMFDFASSLSFENPQSRNSETGPYCALEVYVILRNVGGEVKCYMGMFMTFSDDRGKANDFSTHKANYYSLLRKFKGG